MSFGSFEINVTKKVVAYTLCFVQRVFSRLSGIRAGQLISSSLIGPSSQVLIFLGGVGFIACRRGPRHFYSHQTRLSHTPALGST